VLVMTEEQCQLTLYFNERIENIICNRTKNMILNPDGIYFETYRDKYLWTIPYQQETFGCLLRKIMSTQDLFLQNESLWVHSSILEARFSIYFDYEFTFEGHVWDEIRLVCRCDGDVVVTDL